MEEQGRHDPPQNARSMIGNLVALVVSLLFFYFVVGSLFLRFAPALLPGLSNHFPTAANIWWQASAPDPTHNDYVALLGDSYAEGLGDWKAQRKRVDEPFHSADIIHQITGRNILSFGHSAAGSAEGFVKLPVRALNAGDCLIFPAPRVPTEVIYYFYEGNDLNDNIDFIEKGLRLKPDAAGIKEAAGRYFAQKMGKIGFATCVRYFGDTIRALTQTVLKSFRSTRWESSHEEKSADEVNRAVVGGAIVAIPARLQGPSMELDDRSTDAAFEVFEAAMDWFINEVPNVKITIVDIPSVLTNYRLADSFVTTETYQHGNAVQPSAQIAPRSDMICERLRDLAVRHGQSFIDARPALREAASRGIIHGPLDWKHFNRVGYTRLGETVAAALAGDVSFSTCGHLAAN